MGSAGNGRMSRFPHRLQLPPPELRG
jgi:hypothetical protein